MLKSLSGAAPEQLTYFLARIREIAALGDEAALIETDKLLWEFGGDWDEGDPDEMVAGVPSADWNRVQSAERLGYRLEYMRDRIQHQVSGFRGRSYEAFGLIRLREELEMVRSGGAGGTAPDEHPETQRLLAECASLLDGADDAVFEVVLREGENADLKNINSALRVASGIDQALKHYETYHPVMPDQRMRARRGKERCARFREGKKQAAARVADAAGSAARAANLRREAAALLEQDWAAIFSDVEAATTKINVDGHE